MDKKVETMTCQEVAKILHTTPMKVKAAIKNGTMPIGMVARDEHSTQDRTIIIKKRFEKWVSGEMPGMDVRSLRELRERWEQ